MTGQQTRRPETAVSGGSMKHEWAFVGAQAGPDHPAFTPGDAVVLAVCSYCGIVRA